MALLLFLHIIHMAIQGYYKPSQTEEYTESSEGGNSDFLAVLSHDWEKAGILKHDTQCRHVIVRIGKGK